MYYKYLSEIQVHFKLNSAEIKEFEKAIIPVGFTPPRTTISFTIRVEAFDISARGSVYIIKCFVLCTYIIQLVLIIDHL